MTESTTGTFRLAVRTGVRASFRITRLDPPRSWTWRGRVFWLNVDYNHELHPQGAGTEVVFRVRAAGPAVGSIGRVFAAVYQRNLDRAIPRFVALFRQPRV